MFQLPSTVSVITLYNRHLLFCVLQILVQHPEINSSLFFHLLLNHQGQLVRNPLQLSSIPFHDFLLLTNDNPLATPRTGSRTDLPLDVRVSLGVGRHVLLQLITFIHLGDSLLTLFVHLRGQIVSFHWWRYRFFNCHRSNLLLDLIVRWVVNALLRRLFLVHLLTIFLVW